MTAVPQIPSLWRTRAHIHFLMRGLRRGLVFSAWGVAELEAFIEAFRPAFVRADRRRHLLRIRRSGHWLTVVYDTRVGCVVTVWRGKRGR